MFGCIPPTFGSAFAAAGSSEKSSVPTMRLPAPIAYTISVRFGASVMMRATRGGTLTGRLRSSRTLPVSRGAQASAQRRRKRALRVRAFFVLEIIGNAEAVAGGGIHLLGGVDRALQLRDLVLDLGELFLDPVLQVADLLFGDLQRCFVELTLLISQNRHSRPPKTLS